MQKTGRVRAALGRFRRKYGIGTCFYLPFFLLFRYESKHAEASSPS